jgi:hypothetical protein
MMDPDLMFIEVELSARALVRADDLGRRYPGQFPINDFRRYLRAVVLRYAALELKYVAGRLLDQGEMAEHAEPCVRLLLDIARAVEPR